MNQYLIAVKSLIKYGMTIQFSELLDFCFNESPLEKQKIIALKILTDEEVFSIIRGLNLLKEELGTKEKVNAYLENKISDIRLNIRFDFR
ncbi:MAG: hypothetical protein R3A50_16675 [Saprospiraceae bacterium]